MFKYISAVIVMLVCLAAWVNYTPAVHPLQLVIPKGWPQPVYDFKTNPLTEEGFQLGRKLFYDGRLSKDGSFSCASCHQQYAAFATYDHKLSHGYNHSFTKRNAPTLFNLAWQPSFMWDGSVTNLESQHLVPINDASQMAETTAGVLSKLKADTAYRRMFKAAFGDDQVTADRMTRALSQFLLMMVSSNSKYDRVKRGEDSFNLPQQLGYAIFQRKCAQCHTEPLFTDYSYRNIGLPADKSLRDNGRAIVTGMASDSLKFRVPTLRNAVVSFPYMHDGRFYSFLDVMNFYKSPRPGNPATDSLVKHGIPLSNYEMGQLSAFLKTLVDSGFLEDPRFAPPGYEKNLPQAPRQDIHQ